MDSSSVVWESKERTLVKNSKNHLDTLLIKLPFRWEVFALKYVEKTFWKDQKNWFESSPKILEKNNDQTPKFIGSEKLAVGVCQACRSTVRSTAAESSALWISGSTGRSTGGSNGSKYDRWTVDRPVDRQHWQIPTAIFFWPINWGSCHLFWEKILEISKPVFPILLTEFSPHIWVQILPIKREDFIKSV